MAAVLEHPDGDRPDAQRVLTGWCRGVVLVGGAYVPVYGRWVFQGAEHAGGEVCARDAEAAGQVAVDRDAVSPLAGLLVSDGGRKIVQSRSLARISSSAVRKSALTCRSNVCRATGLSR